METLRTKKNDTTSLDQKIMQPLGTKKITQPLWTKKNHASSRDNKKIMQPLWTRKSGNLSGQKNRANS